MRRHCIPPFGLYLRKMPHSLHASRQNTSSNPHPRPVDQFASSCIRSQMRLSTCPAPHSSPGGLRLCSSAFARWCKATGCIRSRLPSLQQDWIYIPISITRRCTPPCGLHLHNMPHRQTPKHSQQSAFAPGCSIRIGLHSQSDEAQHLPCTALQPWGASFVQQVLSPAGARQQAASAAGCLLCCKSGSTYSSALPGAALRPAGSICAAMLSLRNATARIRCRSLSCSKSASAFSCIYHSSPPEHSQQSAFAPGCNTRIGLHSQSNEAQHLPCTALQPWRASFVQQVLSPAGARQQAASAAGCLLCSKSAAAFAALFCQGPHTSPEGLRLHSIAAPPEHSQQSAFAPS